LEDLNIEEIQFGSVEDFLAELKREFGEGNNKSAKVAELKKNKIRIKNNREACTKVEKSNKKKWI